MTLVQFSLATGAAGVAAGFLGALSGLGGGVVIVPVLTLLLGVDLHYAIGASLIAVLATSSGAAAAYVREGFTHIRMAMFLEIATTLGAVTGAALVAVISKNALSLIFAGVLIYAALNSLVKTGEPTPGKISPWAQRLGLEGSYPVPGGEQPYAARAVTGGFSLMVFAGALAGLLGIGSGAFKVLAMDRVMGLPFKVSTTTSNFMIGVTAAAGAGVYLHEGYIHPQIAMPVLLGVLAGATLGARVLLRLHVRWLRPIFGLLVLVMGLEMLFEAWPGGM